MDAIKNRRRDPVGCLLERVFLFKQGKRYVRVPSLPLYITGVLYEVIEYQIHLNTYSLHTDRCIHVKEYMEHESIWGKMSDRVVPIVMTFRHVTQSSESTGRLLTIEKACHHAGQYKRHRRTWLDA